MKPQYSKNSQVLLEVNDIYKHFQMGGKKLEVLKGVNFTLNRGEIASILGISGSGKSTLLSIIGTLDQPNSGSVVLSGQNITALDESRLAIVRNLQIGFIFQFHYLLPEFTAQENVAMPGFIRDAPHKKVMEKARSILCAVGLEERLHHKPNELSGGELQRVAVARALINDPALVLADEPTGNLDKQNGDAIYSLMLDLSRKNGRTFLVVTHNELIASKTDRILTLSDGAIK